MDDGPVAALRTGFFCQCQRAADKLCFRPRHLPWQQSRLGLPALGLCPEVASSPPIVAASVEDGGRVCSRRGFSQHAGNGEKITCFHLDVSKLLRAPGPRNIPVGSSGLKKNHTKVRRAERRPLAMRCSPDRCQQTRRQLGGPCRSPPPPPCLCPFAPSQLPSTGCR